MIVVYDYDISPEQVALLYVLHHPSILSSYILVVTNSCNTLVYAPSNKDRSAVLICSVAAAFDDLIWSLFHDDRMQPLIHLCPHYPLGAPYPSAKDRPIVVRRSEWWAEMTPPIRPWMIYDGHGRCMLRDIIVREHYTIHLMMVHHTHNRITAAA